MCCIGIEPSTAPWSLATFASGRVLPARTVNFASLTVLTIACFGNPLGAAKTDDVASNEQMLAKAKEIDFMILPYVFMTGRQAQSLPNPIATSRRTSQNPFETGIPRAPPGVLRGTQNVDVRSTAAAGAVLNRFSIGLTLFSNRDILDGDDYDECRGFVPLRL